jgi:hypothetical protein
MRVATRIPGDEAVTRSPNRRIPTRRSRVVFGARTSFVVVALLLLDVFGGATYAIVVASSALVLSVATFQWALPRRGVDLRDLIWAGALYLGVVGLFRVAFAVFTTDRTALMFLAFAAGLLFGTVGPIVYTVWVRGRPLTSLGLGLHNLRTTLWLALIFGGVQFSITLWGYDLPAPVNWIPLLAMSLTVGVFESVFFRGFLQGRLEASFGRASAVVVASVLYGVYHIGYGMGAGEVAFLFGLGVVYAVAYALCGNLLVLWPLLTPMGSFFAQLDSGELVGKLPWAAIMGFADVLGLMAAAVVLARRHLRRRRELADQEVSHAWS